MSPSYILVSLGPCQFNTMNEWMTKDENVFLPPIKKISLFTDMICGLVSGHVDFPCPLNLNFMVKAKSKHSQE